jgi:hypothetical protein
VGGTATPTPGKLFRKREAFCADGQCLVAFRYCDLLKRLQILLDVGPFKCVTGFLQAALQFFSQNQSQEAAKDMAPDGRVLLMKNRTGFQDGFDIPEGLFDLP